MTKKTRNWLIISGIVVIVGGGVAYGATHRKSTIEYTTADVTKGTLIQTVNETGTITPAKEIELNFLNTGQLTQLSVKVGDQVMPEQVLGQIDFSSLAIKQQEAMASLNVSQANVSQSQANYESALREYDKLSASLKEVIAQAQKTQRDLEDRGPTTVTTQEQAITTAESSLATTRSTYQRGIDNKSDALALTVENKLASAASALDDVNRILTDDGARPTLAAKDSGSLTLARSNYQKARSTISAANASLASYKAAHNDGTLTLVYTGAQNALNDVFQALNATFSVLEASITSSTFTQTQLDAYKATINTQITTTSNSVSAFQAAKQALDDARLSYDTNMLSAEQNINQAKAAYDNAVRSARNASATALVNRDQQLASAQSRIDSAAANLSVVRAQVGQASANVESVRNQIQNNILKSPIKGIITKINYEIGEQVTPQKAFLSVLTENNYQLEVDIAETDINKVKISDSVTITLDSFGDAAPFSGKVYFIDPAQTVIQGVTYYKVKISFDPGASAVKPGMTADAVITTAQKENILIMPSRAIVERDNAKFVRILENGIPRENPVSIGLAGDNGLVEVLSGVKEGDKVVTFVKDSSKK